MRTILINYFIVISLIITTLLYYFVVMMNLLTSLCYYFKVVYNYAYFKLKLYFAPIKFKHIYTYIHFNM